MESIQQLFANAIIDALGWTIIHSLWQGSILVIILSLFLVIFRKFSAQVRYLVSFGTLLLMITWSGFTFTNAYNDSVERAQIKENLLSSPQYLQSLLSSVDTNNETTSKSAIKSLDIQTIQIRSFLQRNFSIICSLWIIGILFLTIRLATSILYVRRLRTHKLQPIGNEWIVKIEEIATKLNINQKIRSFFSPLVESPLTLGFIKPILLFPFSAFSGLSTREIEAIIAHELAHIKRHDYLFNILQSLIEILFFYHPAVWIISSRIRNERENSCDNIAIALTGDKITFAKALFAISRKQFQQQELAMTFAKSNNNISLRIKRLQKKSTMKTNFTEGLIAVSIIAIGLFLASFAIPRTNAMGVVSGTQNMDATTNYMGTTDTLVYKASATAIDSFLNQITLKVDANSDDNQISKEIEKVIEVALTEEDDQMTLQILQNVDGVLSTLNISEIIGNALNEASVEIRKAKTEIDHEAINKDMAEAMRDIEEARREVKEEMETELKNASEEERAAAEMGALFANMGLNIAESVIKSLPLDKIIESSLETTAVVLSSMGNIKIDSLVKNKDLSEKDIKKMQTQLAKQQLKLEKQQKEIEKQ
ncbi:MAG: M56 family metallopeptidase, partial [Salinivirgaceae bacterium]|nr:M56 family metallopeptidase [Salinivirgaceae bacterium]